MYPLNNLEYSAAIFEDTEHKLPQMQTATASNWLEASLKTANNFQEIMILLLFCHCILVLFAHDAVVVPYPVVGAAVAPRGEKPLVLVHIQIHHTLVGVGLFVVIKIVAVLSADVLHSAHLF